MEKSASHELSGHANIMKKLGLSLKKTKKGKFQPFSLTLAPWISVCGVRVPSPVLVYPWNSFRWQHRLGEEHWHGRLRVLIWASGLPTCRSLSTYSCLLDLNFRICKMKVLEEAASETPCSMGLMCLRLETPPFKSKPFCCSWKLRRHWNKNCGAVLGEG